MTPDYITLPDPAAATLIASRLQAWDKAQRLSYAETGLMCLEVERRLLWKHYALEDGTPCHSFNHFLRVCCPWAYSTAYAAMRDCKALPDVPADALAEIPQSNFITMKQISTAYRNRPDVLAASKSLGLDKFMAQTYPEQLIPQRTSLRFAPTPDQRADIEDALRLAKAGEDISPTEALWRICAEYMQTYQPEPDEFGDMATEVIQ
jgi:hypothetical protein